MMIRPTPPYPIPVPAALAFPALLGVLVVGVAAAGVAAALAEFSKND